MKFKHLNDCKVSRALVSIGFSYIQPLVEPAWNTLLPHWGLVTPCGDKSGSTLAQVMACCKPLPEHRLIHLPGVNELTKYIPKKQARSPNQSIPEDRVPDCVLSVQISRSVWSVTRARIPSRWWSVLLFLLLIITLGVNDVIQAGSTMTRTAVNTNIGACQPFVPF